MKESEPPITETEVPTTKNPQPVNIDIDDEQIEEPKGDAFRKSPQPVKAPKRRKKA